MAGLRIVDVLDAATFALAPPCADPNFDHRTCDYWEDADRGSRTFRAAWLDAAPSGPAHRPRPGADNPFAPAAPGAERRRDALAALLGADEPDQPATDAWGPPADADEPSADWNPFAPAEARRSASGDGQPRKLSLLRRGERVFGSYAFVAIEDDQPVAYAQFGPLSAYPRAQRLRELYPRLPSAPLPAVITCIATTAEARGRGHAMRLVDAVCDALGKRGFSAIEVYPDLTEPADGTSAATPRFWEACGFTLVIPDERYPVLRRELA
ncbi:MAG: GNAT family N-acetyltransferase [Chloroflexota bacterium]